MNKLDPKKQAQVVSALVEGNSIRATVRMTGVAKNTVLKLLVEIGAAWSEFLDDIMQNLPCQRCTNNGCECLFSATPRGASLTGELGLQ